MKSFEIVKSDSWPEYDVKITLKPCFRCNQQCWFCNEYDNNTRMWTIPDCNNVLRKLKSLPDRYNRVFVYFYGGEPTLSENWEYLHYMLFDIYKERDVFFQTQTNMSVKSPRLERFLSTCETFKPDNHTIDICSSYHIGKQDVDDFITKMNICKDYRALGNCFFSTEVPKEEQMMKEFDKLIESHPDKIKLKFTVIPKLKQKKLKGYEHILNDEDLISSDNGQYAEFRYFTKKYPHMLDYLEQEWNFKVDDEVINYVDVKHRKLHEQCRMMSCECGKKGIVVDHDLNVFHCNDDNYNNINGIKLSELDLTTYLERNSICMNRACWDGLDFKKTSLR